MIHHTDTGHHGRPVRNCKTFTDIHLQRLKSKLSHDLTRRSDLALVRNFAFAYQGQCNMCQLHQVAARAHASVTRNHRTHAIVYK